MVNGYSWEGNAVYVTQYGIKELFLTVHPTDTGGTVTVEEQAERLVRLLMRNYTLLMRMGLVQSCER